LIARLSRDSRSGNGQQEVRFEHPKTPHGYPSLVKHVTAGSVFLKFFFLLILFALCCPLKAQVYKVGPDSSQKVQATPVQPANQQLGFGSNIQTARLAHAAQAALERGDHTVALDYAQRAAQADATDPQLWFLVGYAARLDSKFALSENAYARGLRLAPSALDGLSGLAQTYSIVGRSKEAEHLLDKVIAADPRRRDDVLLMGDLYMKAGDYTSAIVWLRRADALQSDARSELLLALSYQHLNQMDLASRYLNLARHRSPDNPDILRSLAGYYRATGDYRQAIAALSAIRDPRPDVVAELAFTSQLDGKLSESAVLYAQAARARPRDLELQLSAAQAQVAAGSVEDALPLLERAAGIDPNAYRLHAIRGEIAQLQQKDEQAVKEYTSALAHLPALPAEGPLYGIQLHMDLFEIENNRRHKADAREQLAIAQRQIAALDEQGAGRAPFLRLRALIRMNGGQLDSALSDMKEALAISPRDPNNLQLDGDLLMKLGRTTDAIAVYKRVLAIEPRNRFALTSLGYASRAAGRDQDAEKYFTLLEQAYPGLYVPYLALGDLYTAHGEFQKAQVPYSKGFGLAPRNALIVAGGMNAAIESHDLSLAGLWLDRATPEMQQEPKILLEKERYLSFTGQYEQSATVGEQAIKVLPNDRDVVIYLGYDLLRLERYDELLQLTARYDQILPLEPDIPLLAGYVHKHNGQREQAVQDFTEVLHRDPNVVTAYVNRGYLFNDLHQARAAATDFEAALKREPKDGEAHLGLAYAYLDLHRPQGALRQTQLAEQVLGDSRVLHMIRATAYGRQGLLSKAALEYRAALKFTPNDGTLHFGLADTLFGQRHYHQAVDELLIANRLSPQDPAVYALLARAYAQLGERDLAMQNIQLAEERVAAAPTGTLGTDPGDSEIFVATGEALTQLGNQKEAMERFEKALTSRDGNRVDVRLAIAQVMAQQDHNEDAERQIGLAVMEAEAGETAPPTGSQYIEAADVLRQMHEYQLSQTYLERAKAAGASDVSVRVGLANNYLALGDTARAAAQLSAVSHVAGSEPDYQYLLAEASVYQQEHQGTQALTAFAQAASAAGEDQTAEQNLLQAGANEGYRVSSALSLLTDFSLEPVFEDSTVYVLDSKLDAITPVPVADSGLLPPPRSSLALQSTTAYHLHLGDAPTLGGFFQVRNARGQISVPATNSIVNRDTTDYSINLGIAPTFHPGSNVVTLNSGVQETIRRDAKSPVQMNQNLFRVFTYVSTSSFFNLLSADGYVIFETGPFTESNLHSQALAAAVDFRVGAPWAKTTLVTGWGRNHQQFSPVSIENYYTTSYVGLTHRFSENWNAEAVVEDLRAWRVVAAGSGIAQVLRPAGNIDFAPNRHWDLQASVAYSSTRGFHAYDAVQSGFSLSYATPLRRKFHDESGEVHLQYPIRFSAGLQQETFFNFTNGQSEQFRPYVSITLF
jgi:tetratricopeptide (TPR) repeat protein